MKIAIPTDKNSLDAPVADVFGRSAYYLIYDTDNQSAVFVDNTAAASQGGAGIKAAQLVVDQDVAAVLAPRCGENAAKIIQGAGIKLYQTVTGTLQENINAFNAGKLESLQDIHAGFHNHGAK